MNACARIVFAGVPTSLRHARRHHPPGLTPTDRSEFLTHPPHPRITVGNPVRFEPNSTGCSAPWSPGNSVRPRPRLSTFILLPSTHQRCAFAPGLAPLYAELQRRHFEAIWKLDVAEDDADLQPRDPGISLEIRILVEALISRVTLALRWTALGNSTTVSGVNHKSPTVLLHQLRAPTR